MTLRILLGSLALSVSVSAQALRTDDLPETTLLALGASLARQAGSSQWQQLWQRTREAGHLTAGGTPHFTLPHPDIAARVKATLADAGSVSAEGETLARYRRDFHPLEVGQADGAPLSAICLWVDWRSAPQRTLAGRSDQLGQVSLLVSKPCP